MNQSTALYSWHQQHQGRFVDFAGWQMPIIYTTIVQEHQSTRQAATLFDISHMGRILFTGPDRVAFLDRLLTNHVANLQPFQVRYALVLHPDGGTMDDILVYRLQDEHLLVVNAANRLRLLEWFEQQRHTQQVAWTDLTNQTAMIACQGPLAIQLASNLLGAGLTKLRYYFCTRRDSSSPLELISRTGYTGEDGIEWIVPVEQAATIWEQLLAHGQTLTKQTDSADAIQVRPAGLGARDTLRLEAGMCLYGHELTDSLDPIQAGLAWAVKWDKEFIGRSGLEQRAPHRPVRVGLRLADRRIAREGTIVKWLHQSVGTVTSGTFSPTLQASIAMAFVTPEHSQPGTPLHVVIRDQEVAATVVPLPFYSRRNSA